MKPSRRGRPGGPSRLAPEQRARFLNALRLPGVSRALAAAEAGIGLSTVYTWLQRGRTQRRGEFRDFLDDVRGAEAAGEKAAIAALNRAGFRAKNPDWRAIAFILERRFPKRWGRVDRHQLEGGKTPVPIAFTPAFPLPGAPGSAAGGKHGRINSSEDHDQ